MGFDEPYLQDSDLDIVQAALNSDHPHLRGITLESLMRDGYARLAVPERWRPFADGGFATPSGKCELYSEQMASWGMDPLPAFTPGPESAVANPELAESYPLSLITGKTALHFLNSSYAGLARHRKAEGEPRVDISAADAAARGIVDGDAVRVFNARGSVVARARVGDRVRPGVAAMPSGWWASLSGGSSANALTPDGLADFGGGGDFHDCLVEIEPAPVAAAIPPPAAAAAPPAG
jgi:anaerobic selenocysteine-containing dehydrogenase